MRKSVLWIVCALLGAPGPTSAQSPGADCEAATLQPEGVKERLKRWGGLAAFNRWRLLDVRLEPCQHQGQVGARLELAPPATASRRDLPYRLPLGLQLAADSGQPLSKAPADWSALAAGSLRLIARAEAHEDVRRFVDRHRVVRAEIGTSAQAGKLQLSFLAVPALDSPVEWAPMLVYSEASPGAIAAYRIPNMGALPARPELLRFLEIVSGQHPRCRPVQIEARQSPALDPEANPVRWTLRCRLEGESGCPTGFSANLGPDGSVAEAAPDFDGTPTKGD